MNMKKKSKISGRLVSFLLALTLVCPDAAQGIVITPLEEETENVSSDSGDSIVIEPLEPEGEAGSQDNLSDAVRFAETGILPFEQKDYLTPYDVFSDDYQDWYIDQHLSYIDSFEYRNNVMNTPGSEAGMIADAFDSALMAGWNNAWQSTAFVMNVIGGDDISFEDPIELIVSTKMAETISSKEYGELFARNYYNAVDLLLQFLAVLPEAPITKLGVDVAVAGSPGQLGDYAGMLQTFRTALEQADLAGDATDLMKSSENVLTRLDDMFKDAFPSGLTQEFIQGVKLYWKFGDSVIDFSSAGFHEFTRAIVLWQAYQQTSESWINFWTMVMAEAAVESGSEHGRLIKLSNTGDIADEIEKNLADVQKAKESCSLDYVLQRTDEKMTAVMAAETIEIGATLLHEMLPPTSKLRAVMDATKLTHELINVLTNMDDMTYYGQLAFGSAELTRCASFALSLAAEELRAEQDYESAHYFDEAFHYYKSLILSTLDYTTAYDKCITEAWLYPVVSRLAVVNPQYMARRWTGKEAETSPKEEELKTLAAIRGIWAARECHMKSQLEVIAENRNLWDPLRDSESYTSYYSMAVTDMNNNGCLEVITAWTMGSGSFTSFKMYEVDASGTALIPCSIDAEKFQPDMGWDEAVDVFRENDSYWMLFRDYLRNGWAENLNVSEILSLREGGFDAEILGLVLTNNFQDGSSTVAYYDGNNQEITEEMFDGLGEARFPDAEKGTMTFRWISHEEIDEKNPLPALLDSWQGFGCDLF